MEKLKNRLIEFTYSIGEKFHTLLTYKFTVSEFLVILILLSIIWRIVLP